VLCPIGPHPPPSLLAPCPVTCDGGVEVLELLQLVGTLAAGQAVLVRLVVLGQRLLHVGRAAPEIPVVVQLHRPHEYRLPGTKRAPLSSPPGAAAWPAPPETAPAPAPTPRRCSSGGRR